MKHNTKIKTYPDGHEKVTICSIKLFNDSPKEDSRGADEMPCETVCKPKNMDSCSRYCEPLKCSFKYLDSSDPDNYAELKTLGLLSDI